eukprot:scaffold13317_cov33-Tisochrysis_lutea.AAC.6
MLVHFINSSTGSSCVLHHHMKRAMVPSAHTKGLPKKIAIAMMLSAKVTSIGSAHSRGPESGGLRIRAIKTGMFI